MSRTARSRRGSPVLAAAEAGLWAVSLAFFGLVGWQLFDAASFQAEAREALSVPMPRLAPPSARTPSGRAPSVGASAPASPAVSTPEGTPIGILEIPRLDLSVVVAEGDSEAVLARAVGRLPWSGRPGEGGNVVLAGHRDTFFAPLSRIQVADEILFRTPRGETRYRVDWTAVVEPTDVDLVAASEGSVLTLVTCFPFRNVGPAPRRFVVRAVAVETLAPPTG